MAQLWGGRFTKELDSFVNDFNASILFDCRMFRQDIDGSIAHVTMLAEQGILTQEEKEQITTGLPVTLAHHLGVYVEMALRDIDRLDDTYRRMNICPLGAAALAGTSYPLNRQMTSQLLKFDRPTRNSMDPLLE